MSELNYDAHTPEEVKVAHYSRKQGLEYFHKSQFGRALAHLFVTLRLAPEWRDQLHTVFCQALSGGCQQLETEGRLQETIQLRKDSLQFYPEDALLLMDLGSVYYKLDDIELALEFYQQAIQVSPCLLPASRAVQSIYNKQVERWHFRMLNDLDRNKAYYQAIAYRILEGYTSVLDVGAGTGLLSLYAAEKGAENISACESNPIMCKIAQEVLAANNASGRVNLLNKRSDLLTIPSDIPEKVSLLVTEVFDAGLLGEGVIPMLMHAWENLLVPPCSTVSKENSGVVVPFSATVYAAAIQCIDISRRHRLLPFTCLCKESKNLLCSNTNKFPVIMFGKDKLCKACEAPCDGFVPDEGDIKYSLDGTAIAFCLSEPYTTEDLADIPFGFEMLSKPYKVFEINFNNIEELKAYGFERIKEELVSVHIESSGSVDAIASWFHLNLDNNGTNISTAPFKESGYFQGTCWHQAIFPSRVPRQVTQGDVVNLHINAQESVLKIFQRESEEPVLPVSQQVVRFLNNRTWISALQETAKNLSKNMSSKLGSERKILDLNPFPVLGLQMLKRCGTNWKLTVKAETREDKIYILMVSRQNSIDVEQIDFVTDDSLEEDSRGEYFDVICVNVIDPSGELVDNITGNLTFLNQKLSSTGIIVPSMLTIECQLIESPKLIHNSRVLSDEKTMSFKIGEFINKYAVDYHLDVSYAGANFKMLSSPFEVLSFNLKSTGCGQHMSECSVRPTGTGTVTGIIYWIKVNLLPGTESISTACYDSNCNQVVSFSSQKVELGTEVVVRSQYWHGILDVKFVGS